MVAGVNTLVVDMLVRSTPFKAEDFTMLNLPSRDYTLMATGVAVSPALKSIDDVVKALQADPKTLLDRGTVGVSGQHQPCPLCQCHRRQ